VEAVKQDPRADDKLKRFSQCIGEYHSSKDTGVPVKGESGKTYRVKYLAKAGRFGCNCKHWTFDQSHKTAKNADCKHIAQVKRSMEKNAGLEDHFWTAMGSLNTMHNAHEAKHKAAVTNLAFKNNIPQPEPLFKLATIFRGQAARILLG
jgi:hypothetical protein